MEEIKLQLTEEEIRKISKIASDRKFIIKNVESIYTQDAVEKMKVFVKSYRFLFHLQNNIKEKEISEKISNYLKNINNIYVESVKLLEKLDSRIEYGKHRYKQKLFDLMLENIKIVDDLIDVVFPLGRVVKLYDPETDTSYIHQ
jgi:hypothetical protein